MRSSDILNIGEAVMTEEPKTPNQAVLWMQRKTLQIGLDELRMKCARFEKAIVKLERELKRVDGLCQETVDF